MPQAHNPTVRGRKLARELREVREQIGLLPEHVAERLGWSRQKLMRIEKAQSKIGAHDLDTVLDLYGVPSPHREALLQLSKDAWKRGWWTAYRDVFNGTYLALEDEADQIRAWEPQAIPGILQTPDYARSIIQALRGNDNPEVDRRVASRMTRRALLSRPDSPRLHFIVDESAIRREVGGPQVMRTQLESLLNDLERPNLTLQLLPFAAGSHAGLAGAFALISFDSELHPDIVYVESSGGELYLEAPSDVTRCDTRFKRLSERAQSPKESRKSVIRAVEETSLDH